MGSIYFFWFTTFFLPWNACISVFRFNQSIFYFFWYFLIHWSHSGSFFVGRLKISSNGKFVGWGIEFLNLKKWIKNLLWYLFITVIRNRFFIVLYRYFAISLWIVFYGLFNKFIQTIWVHLLVCYIAYRLFRVFRASARENFFFE